MVDSIQTSTRQIFVDHSVITKKLINKSSQSITYKIAEFIDYCSHADQFLKGAFAPFVCNFTADFSEMTFFPPMIEFVMSKLDGAYQIPKSTKMPSVILPCPGKCECFSDNPNLCHSCQSTQREVIYGHNPLILDCLDCDSLCTDCVEGFCLACDYKLSFEIPKTTLVNRIKSNFVICQACHSDCLEGCTGPSQSDCKLSDTSSGGTSNSPLVPIILDQKPSASSCPLLCDQCDAEFNCVKCSLFPFNVIFQYDFDSNSFIITDFFFCESCNENCLFCSSKNSCLCPLKTFSVILYGIYQFNVCKQIPCPLNCVNCVFPETCLECKPGYELTGGRCSVSLDKPNNCYQYQNKKCVKCMINYYLDSRSKCQKCPSNCIKCSRSSKNDSIVCTQCSSSLTSTGTCVVSPEFSNPLGINISFQLLSNHIASPKIQKNLNYSDCISPKNAFTNICLKCGPNRYRAQNRCLPCPTHSRSCQYSHLLSKFYNLQCKDTFFYNSKYSRCTKCPSKCLICSSKGCIKCIPEFKLVQNHCISCQDPNCILCSIDSKCVRCKNSYFFDSYSQKCQSCSKNCKYCESASKCLKCHSSYTKNAQHACQEACRPGLTFYSSSLQKCISCSKCQFCYFDGPTECSSCLICQTTCEIRLSRLSRTSVQFYSKSIVLPIESELSINFSQSFQGIVKADTQKLLFEFAPSNREVTATIHTHNFKTKRCSMQSALALLLLPGNSGSVLESDLSKIITRIASFSEPILQSVFVMSSFSGNALNANSLILLLNMNSLFNYSYILKPPKSGLTLYFSSLIFFQNKQRNFENLLTRQQSLYLSIFMNEFNIRVMSFKSYLTYMSCLVMGLFFALSLYHASSQDQKVRELFPLFLGRHMDRTFMTRFFQIYRRKLSTRKMNEIIQFLRRTKKKIKSSKLRKRFRRIMRLLHSRRYQIVFVFFQFSCIGLSHLSVKSIKMIILMGSSSTAIALASLYHCLLGFYLSISLLRFQYLLHFLPLYIKKDKKDYLQEFIMLSCNIPFTIFTVLYVYIVMLFSNRMSHFLLFTILFIFYLMSIFMEMRLLSFGKKFVILRLVCNFPLLVVLHFSAVQENLIGSLGFDFMFFYMNFSKIILIVFEFVIQKNKILLNKITDNYKFEQ